MSKYVRYEDVGKMVLAVFGASNAMLYALQGLPIIDIVKCKECKHRPVKEDENGENYGFNLIKPNGDDFICPCLVEDGWYSWMPNDDFYCGHGERKSDE